MTRPSSQLTTLCLLFRRGGGFWQMPRPVWEERALSCLGHSNCKAPCAPEQAASLALLRPTSNAAHTNIRTHTYTHVHTRPHEHTSTLSTLIQHTLLSHPAHTPDTHNPPSFRPPSHPNANRHPLAPAVHLHNEFITALIASAQAAAAAEGASTPRLNRTAAEPGAVPTVNEAAAVPFPAGLAITIIQPLQPNAPPLPSRYQMLKVATMYSRHRARRIHQPAARCVPRAAKARLSCPLLPVLFAARVCVAPWTALLTLSAAPYFSVLQKPWPSIKLDFIEPDFVPYANPDVNVLQLKPRALLSHLAAASHTLPYPDTRTRMQATLNLLMAEHGLQGGAVFSLSVAWSFSIEGGHLAPFAAALVRPLVPSSASPFGIL